VLRVVHPPGGGGKERSDRVTGRQASKSTFCGGGEASEATSPGQNLLRTAARSLALCGQGLPIRLNATDIEGKKIMWCTLPQSAYRALVATGDN